LRADGTLTMTALRVSLAVLAPLRPTALLSLKPPHHSRRQSLAANFRCSFFSSKIDEDTSTAKAPVDVSVDAKGIAHVRLNRPDKLNALDMTMFEQLTKTARDLQSDRSLRAVILSGNGRAFSTGLDVKSILRNNPNASIERLLERNGKSNLAQDVGYIWRELPIPVIAALHGMCFGGGLQLALGADIRLATPDCKLSIMEAKWGLIPDMSASVTLRELMRIDVAKELTMTGRVFSGTEAVAYGLVTRCVDDPQAEALQLAQEIIQRSPDSVSLTKELYQKTWVAASEEYSLKLETELQLKLLKTWNQLAASGRNFGLKVPYFRRKPSIPPSDAD
jgi:enoyl-CoA hydratase/carnithine racemase